MYRLGVRTLESDQFRVVPEYTRSRLCGTPYTKWSDQTMCPSLTLLRTFLSLPKSRVCKKVKSETYSFVVTKEVGVVQVLWSWPSVSFKGFYVEFQCRFRNKRYQSLIRPGVSSRLSLVGTWSKISDDESPVFDWLFILGDPFDGKILLVLSVWTQKDNGWRSRIE